MPRTVTGQLADTPTRGLPTRGLDNSRTGQVADWTTRGCHRRLSCLVYGFSSFGETASCPVRELTSSRVVYSPRVDQSSKCPVRELAIRELEYPRVVQLPLEQLDTFQFATESVQGIVSDISAFVLTRDAKRQPTKQPTLSKKKIKSTDMCRKTVPKAWSSSSECSISRLQEVIAFRMK